MSALTAFAAKQFQTARTIIGGESLAIAGGTAVSAVLSEVGRERSIESGGWDQDISLDAVVSISDWTANYAAGDSSYFGKTATARGLSFRVESIRRGASFVTIRLCSTKKGT